MIEHPMIHELFCQRDNCFIDKAR